MAVGYGVKTYKVGLLIACKFIRKYVVKWKQQLEENLSPEAYEILLAILDAVETMIGMLESPTSPDYIG
jgi:hypothetical protein